MRNIKIIITVAISGLLFVIFIVVSMYLQTTNQEELQPINVAIRAASMTYKRTFTIKPRGSLSENQFPTPDETTDPVTAVPTETSTHSLNSGNLVLTPVASISPTLAIQEPTEVPLIVAHSTDQSASPTGVLALPQSGWTQYSIVLFITASIVIYLSFLY